MNKEDIEVGMKVKISKEPKPGCYGFGQIGRELTVVRMSSSGLVEASGFIPRNSDGNTQGFIDAENLSPPAFTKTFLKTGMRVEYRDGTIRIVAGNRLLDEASNFCINLSVYEKDLQVANMNVASDFDIMRVWAAPEKCSDFFNISKRGVLLFERAEKSAEQLKKEELSGKMDSIKKQLEELQKEYNSL